MGGACATVAGFEEVVVVAEHGHRRCPRGARRDHVQDLHFRLVGQQPRQLIGVAGHRIGSDQRVEIVLHGAGDRISRSGIAVDINRRRVVTVHRERRAVGTLRDQQSVDECVDLTLLARCVGAGHIDAIAIGRTGRSADEMVVLIGYHHEQRVVLGDAVRREPGKEFAERGIVLLQLRDIPGFTGPERAASGMVVVRVLDIQIDDLYARFEHGRGIAERLSRGWAEGVGEAGPSEYVRNDIAVEVLHRATR